MKKSIFALTITMIFLVLQLLNAQVAQQWANRFNGPVNGEDIPYDIAVDNSGNIYVTGLSVSSGISSDYYTIKYNSTGVVLWGRRFNGPANNNDAAFSITIDLTGNVFVTGRSTAYSSGTGLNYDVTTLKYNSSGVLQWTSVYNGPVNGDDAGNSIAVDASGNVYVAGYLSGSGTGHDIAAIKYNPVGTIQWVRTVSSPGNDELKSIAVDASGNVYATGWGQGNYVTIKYHTSGVQQWIQSYNGPGNNSDAAQSLTIDGSGSVYVTGKSVGLGSGDDYATIKYSSAGVALWVRRYNGPGNRSDGANSIAVDPSGNVYVTGYSTASDWIYQYATLKYNNMGFQQWV